MSLSLSCHVVSSNAAVDNPLAYFLQPPCLKIDSVRVKNNIFFYTDKYKFHLLPSKRGNIVLTIPYQGKSVPSVTCRFMSKDTAILLCFCVSF